MNGIYEELEKLNKSGIAPFHMPGHKRSKDAGKMGDYFGIDITEIDDFDNLHDAEGMILEAEKRANDLYGADETYFLINGSTCGILAAVSATVAKGGKIIAARNCHKSFYHAAYLRELDISFLNPAEMVIIRTDDNGTDLNKISEDKVLWGKIIPEEVEDLCEKESGAEAVIITSPTYEGIPSDIRRIAEIVHKHDKILIVDEAHGAHFGLCEGFPRGALDARADIVIHSVHKTLPSMTQTALLHVQGDRVNRELLKRYLRIYQSSSPSYVLMASIDSCISEIIDTNASELSKVVKYKSDIEKETAICKHLFIPDTTLIPDPCKVLIACRDDSINGQQIYDILRKEYHIQLEMAGDFYGLAIITGYDKEEHIGRFIAAVKDIDKRIDDRVQGISTKGNEINENTYFTGLKKAFDHKLVNISADEAKKLPQTVLPDMVIPFYRAWDGETKETDLSRAAGKIAGDFINLYPPGIPIILPGERFSKELVNRIGDYINTGRNVQGVRISGNHSRLVKIIKA